MSPLISNWITDDKFQTSGFNPGERLSRTFEAGQFCGGGIPSVQRGSTISTVEDFQYYVGKQQAL